MVELIVAAIIIGGCIWAILAADEFGDW